MLSVEMVLGAGLCVRQRHKASSSLVSACGGGILQVKGEWEGEVQCLLRELWLRGAEPSLLRCLCRAALAGRLL